VAVTAMANLAIKVADVDQAAEWYSAHGFEVRDRMSWNGMERADVFLGPIQITLFDRAIYETDGYSVGAVGFLHPALFCDDLDAQIAGHDLLYGPVIVSGTFGRRRIAFVEAPGGIRLEFMEQLADDEGDAT
jgi:catechol 2,3-dioxygenase-like lactoylglutathione lyase family enzyme